MLFTVNALFLASVQKKVCFYCKNHHFFACKSSPKSDANQVENILIFIFMLTMYNLMLVSVESVREHFQSPTDLKNDQILRCISHNPLQQGFQYKWSSAAVHHWGFIIGFLESLHANRPISKSFKSCSKPFKPHEHTHILPHLPRGDLLGAKTNCFNRVIEM